MYRRAIVTFMDILGFRDLISTRSFAEVQKILSLFDATNNRSRLPPFPTNVIQFSDSIARVKAISDGSTLAHPEEFTHELFLLSVAFTQMLHLGYPIRGAITVGDVFWSDHQIFGPGFVRAYELESKFAKWPRLVVDASFLEAFEFHENRVAPRNEFAYFKSTREKIRQDKDGVEHLDFITTSVYADLFEEDAVADYLLMFRRAISNRLKIHSSQPAILEKYKMLADDFNLTVLYWKDRIQSEGKNYSDILFTTATDA